ncbi:GNAT family N-acetyltransferase [Neptuniibacter sp. QD37_6]|uniref:GNAT family N-acetyltransferase n=1 Tax=Neptuniibacter sp. QD37_6 TaxID=3398210 RepID=UPI0039F61B43
MNYSVFDYSQTQQAIELCESAFTASAGEKEGQLLKLLVTKLINETPENDLFGFCSTVDHQMVGAIFFSRLTLPDQTSGFLLSPVAIESEYQGKRVGQTLIRYGLDQLGTQGIELVVTYGDPAFYSKIGFKQVSTELIEPPFNLSQPIGWLAQMVNGKDIKPSHGKIGCAKAFDDPSYW